MNLEDYIKEKCRSVLHFSKKSNVTRANIYKIISGGGFNFDTAIRVVHSTEGLVSYKDLEEARMKGLKTEGDKVYSRNTLLAKERPKKKY